MTEALAPLVKGFHGRVRTPRAWIWLAFKAPRLRLAVVLALVPALAFLLGVALAPPEYADPFVTPFNVQTVFARFLTTVATASSIAVSVAAMTLGRELRGVGAHEDRRARNMEFRERVRAATGRPFAPLALGSFLRLAFERVAQAARHARTSCDPNVLAEELDGIRMDDYLAVVERRAVEVGAAVENARRHPNALLAEALEFEAELTSHLARRWSRSATLPAKLREGFVELDSAVDDVIVGVKFAKTMDIQWGLSRMSTSILLTTVPALLASTLFVLGYGEGAREGLGRTGAAALVAAGLFLEMLPLACFVSFVTRFVFLNQHTLPAEGFVLGPEEWELLEKRTGGARRKGRAA